MVLENVRFNKGEKKGDPAFARQMAALADCYVNDAFGTCHRDEASMVAVPEQFPPDRRAIGFLVEKELQILETLLAIPKTPLYRGDGRRQGLRQDQRDREPHQEGRPAADRRRDDLHVPESAGTSPSARARSRPTSSTWPASCSSSPARSSSCRMDHLVATKPEAGAETKVVGRLEIPDGWFGMDIGPATIAAVRGDHQAGRHGRLERPDGQVRGRGVRDGHQGRSPRPWPPRRP